MYWSVVLGLLGALFGLMGLLSLFFEISFYVEWGLLENLGISLNYSLYIDWMCLFFLCYVFIISGRVVYYRKEYISSEERSHFLILVLLFIFSIILLIIRPNLVSLLFGWDGLGVVSYLLIIYYRNNRSYNAGILTILMNRFGDILLLLRISFIVKWIRWDIIYLFSFNGNRNLVLFLLITAGFTKRAQIPFSSWLPAAIAAPTPVSALVHSSTLVTAGVYLLIRYFSLINCSFLINYIVFISLITTIIAGICANYEIDLKKIIALSTLSQLGVIMFIIGVGNSLMGYYHILIHAIFKALLFLCAGGFIHSLISYQDVRLIGGLGNKIYFFSLGFRGCRMSLIGFPFLAGFYSKDLICEYMLMGKLNLFFTFLFLVRIGLTRSYRIKALRSVWGLSNIISIGIISESWLIIVRIFFLLVGAFINGSIIRWLVMPELRLVILPFFVKILRIFFILLGVYLGSVFKLNIYVGLWSMRRIWFIRKISSGGSTESMYIGGMDYYVFGDSGWNESYRKIGFITLMGYILKLLKYENFLVSLYVRGVIFWFLFFMF